MHLGIIYLGERSIFIKNTLFTEDSVLTSTVVRLFVSVLI